MNQLSFLANVWEPLFLYCQMNNCESHNNNTIEEHTSVKSVFHYFHNCHQLPGSCSFRFNDIGHLINVLKIICSLPFHKPAEIFGQIAATFLIRNFKLLALVYPVKSIFK